MTVGLGSWDTAKMKRDEFVMAVMSAASGRKFSPIQVQKLFFLVDTNIPTAVGGPHFDFRPHDYGPFDANVYRVLKELDDRELAIVQRSSQFSTPVYRLSPQGQERGAVLLSEIEGWAQDYAARVCSFVLDLSSSQLLSAIYKAYPEMAVNSVFREAR